MKVQDQFDHLWHKDYVRYPPKPASQWWIDQFGSVIFEFRQRNVRFNWPIWYSTTYNWQPLPDTSMQGDVVRLETKFIHGQLVVWTQDPFWTSMTLEEQYQWIQQQPLLVQYAAEFVANMCVAIQQTRKEPAILHHIQIFRSLRP